jgi:pyruvate dehydrogenase E1 component alpha subunit
MSDPGKYRQKDEIEQWRQRDPLFRCEQSLQSDYGMSEDDLTAIDDRVIEEMEQAVQFAEESPEPDPEHRFRNHYVEDDR